MSFEFANSNKCYRSLENLLTINLSVIRISVSRIFLRSLTPEFELDKVDYIIESEYYDN